MTENEKTKLFKDIFRGREDAYGAGTGRCVKEQVTDDVLQAHLAGRKRIGRYPLSPDILDGTGTWWVAVDIDNGNLNAAIEIVNKLAEIGVDAYVESSKSKGFHVWVFFTEAISAVKARGLVGYAVNGSDFEVFPKQDSLDGIEYGNYLNLPLFGGSVKEGKTLFLDPAKEYEPYADQWAALKAITEVEPGLIEDLIEAGEIAPQAVGGEKEKSIEDIKTKYVSMWQNGVKKNNRTKALTEFAGHYFSLGIPVDEAIAMAQALDRINPHGSLDDDPQYANYRKQGGKVAYTIRDIYRRNAAKSRRPQAESLYLRGSTFIPSRLAKELMNEFTFLHTGGQLYIYEDGVYRATGEDFMKRICRKRLGEEARINRVREVMAHVRDMTGNEDKSLDINLINVQNGLLDWRTGELLDHDKGHMSIIRIPVAYDPAATCEEIHKFWASTLEPDCVDIVEELFGYALIPDTRFHKAFMLVGEGSNGKSTVLSLLEASVGSENVCKVPIQELCEHRFKRADLFGKLLNVFADLDYKSLRSTTYFKTVVSGDPIDAERKNRDPFSFRPFSRLVFATNEIPRSKDRSYAYYRRWCIIPFPNQFTGSAADKDLLAKITQPSELSGLLNRALNGLRRLFDNGDFSESETVQKAVRDYIKANDTVAAFIDDMCDVTPDGEIERGKLYQAYLQYCESEGYRPESRKVCYLRVRTAGGDDRRVQNRRLFVGITFR